MKAHIQALVQVGDEEMDGLDQEQSERLEAVADEARTALFERRRIPKEVGASPPTPRTCACGRTN